MDEIMGAVEDITALTEALIILVVAPRQGAGEMLPDHLQRMGRMIISECKKIRGALKSPGQFIAT